jgi:hypothetical protein
MRRISIDIDAGFGGDESTAPSNKHRGSRPSVRRWVLRPVLIPIK